MSINSANQPISLHSDWKAELSACISSTEQLLSQLGLSCKDLTAAQQAAATFPLKVPQPFVDRMAYGNPSDPLLQQVLPIKAELVESPNYIADPIQESQYNPVPGIVHKYRNRVLMIVSPNCAINCRYCFRRHFPYEQNRQSKKQWITALKYLRDRPEINEVIYSGGDPLAANDHFLSWLTKQIETISHIKRLRIHSRLPVVIPSRVDTQLLDWLSNTRLKPIMVLHINHANEIDSKVQLMVEKLKHVGINVLNQTVLLKDINDSAAALISLSEKMFDSDIMPYYLHLLDPVQGASHFDIPPEKARQLYREIQAELPGFLLPKLVREIAGETSKTIHGA